MNLNQSNKPYHVLTNKTKVNLIVLNNCQCHISANCSLTTETSPQILAAN